MNEQVLLWVGLGVLVLLCLPVSPIQKLVLEISAWVLRVGLLAVLAGGAYLWFRPGEMPAELARIVNDFPGLLSILPAQGTPGFGLALACLTAAAFVPLLAALDVTRKLAGRVQRIRTLTAAPVAVKPVPPVAPVEETLPVGVPVLRPVERRRAADAMATAGSRIAR
jgi:hypothetical protein